MITLRKLQNLLTNKAFNPYINIDNPDKVLLHLIEEIGEVVSAYRKNYSNLKKELGDVVILLCFFAESVKIDLEHETLTKISENIDKGKFKPNKKNRLKFFTTDRKERLWRKLKYDKPY